MKYPCALLLIALASGLLAGCGDSTPAPPAGAAANTVPTGTQVPVNVGAKKESIVAHEAMPLNNGGSK
jgi:hypothetical protein